MTNWKDYKGLGPFKFEKTLAGTSYNTGDAIVSASNPVWSIEDNRGVSITPTHAPCGYWFSDLKGIPYIIEGLDFSGVTIISALLD